MRKPAIFTGFTGVWISTEKKLFQRLDIYGEHGRIANGSALPKSAAPCRGFTVGSELLQRVDPIVRSLISTG
jgi:hypothetical protein